MSDNTKQDIDEVSMFLAAQADWIKTGDLANAGAAEVALIDRAFSMQSTIPFERKPVPWDVIAGMKGLVGGKKANGRAQKAAARKRTGSN